MHKIKNCHSRKHLNSQKIRGWADKNRAKICACGSKAADSMSIRDRLKQKRQIVKEREANREHWLKQKDKGAK